MMRGPELHLGGGKLAICRRHNCHSLSMMFQNENVSTGCLPLEYCHNSCLHDGSDEKGTCKSCLWPMSRLRIRCGKHREVNG